MLSCVCDLKTCLKGGPIRWDMNKEEVSNLKCVEHADLRI